ncbi:hypothetical protein DdX_09159 [Ditylenchus destructor]|uniref:Uncharacterized protein n=1 Tax=Ditylenchus destructor TaxID=166010 RepID=A0AAD4N2U0_9BILA|nr:hypothetical protein DdX_09159 [Ditylenchus destructor]
MNSVVVLAFIFISFVISGVNATKTEPSEVEYEVYVGDIQQYIEKPNGSHKKPLKIKVTGTKTTYPPSHDGLVRYEKSAKCSDVYEAVEKLLKREPKNLKAGYDGMTKSLVDKNSPAGLNFKALIFVD